MNKCDGCVLENTDTIGRLILGCSDCRRAYDDDNKAIYYRDLYLKRKEGEEKND